MIFDAFRGSMSFGDFLRRAQRCQEVLSLYVNEEDTYRFTVGRIRNVYTDDFIMEHLAPGGAYDGLSVMRIADVYRMTIGDEYTKEVVAVASPQTGERAALPAEETALRALLRYAQDRQKIVSIELHDSDNTDVLGYVEALGDQLCLVRELNRSGGDEGVSALDLEAITMLSCDGEEERALAELVRRRREA